MVWYSFVTVGWSQHTHPSTSTTSSTTTATRSFGHIRSISSFARSPTPVRPNNPGRVHLKSPSLSDISSMSTTQPADTRTGMGSPSPHRTPGMLSAASFDDELDLSTLPDPRSRAMSPASGHGFPNPNHHPDLDEEVATLSTKLINAINHQTTLDDTLSAAKMELDEARETIRQLEARIAEQREMLAGDVWVRRKTVEAEKTKLLGRVAEEKKARQDVEQQKKKIEQELENLTAALFEEANKMVITAKEEARREHEALQRKNDLLKVQLADTEGLLRSQQDQLAELKVVMEQMSTDRDDQTALTAPSSPGFSKFDCSKDDETPLSEGPSQGGLLEPISPSHPTSFTHLLQPVLRTDLLAYEDFVVLVRTTKRLSARSRPPSGSSHSGAMSALGLSLGHSMTPSNGSTASVSTTGTPASALGSLPQTPNTPASALSAASSTLTGGTPASTPVVNLPPLKDSKFYKRALAEDIEPTLRLDIAPGLSWLARRAVLNAMTDGSLIVEPAPQGTPGSLAALVKPQLLPCSLCGENRKDEEHLRTHRFRTSESESAQRYPLCRSYCLVRVRATCDFLGFLRLLRDGHWRADDEDAEKAAWEESVRLREQMFWARIGGGVVPAAHHHQTHAALSKNSPRPSQEGAVSPAQESDKTATPGSKREVGGDDDDDDDKSQKQYPPLERPNAPTSENFPAGASLVSKTRPLTPPPTHRASTPPLSTPKSNASDMSTESLDGTSDGGVKRLSLQIPPHQ